MGLEFDAMKWRLFIDSSSSSLKVVLLHNGNIFIIKDFQTIVYIFIVISTTFWPICPPAFFRCLSNSGTYMELQTKSFIESTGFTTGSYKLPGKLTECGIREGNWRATEEFPPIQGMNVSQTTLSSVALGLFSKELWRFAWIAEWALSPRHSHYGKALWKSVRCKLFCWQLLMLEIGCGGCRAQEVPEKTFHVWIDSFMYSSENYGTMWAFCEYVSPKCSIICLIQQEN